MVEIVLPWPKGLTPNTGRRTTMDSRTGHEAVDRQTGFGAVTMDMREQVQAEFGPNRSPSEAPQREQIIPCSVTFHPPDLRWYDRTNCLYRLKAMEDGVADGLGVNDARFWNGAIELGDAVKGGKVVMRLG